MKLTAAILIMLPFLADSLSVSAGEFQPPRAYDSTRYEGLWAKNPFTLKTAPAAVLKESFAKDLAISSIFGFGENTTVNVVNIKTREHFRLNDKEPNQPGGIKVKSVNVRDTRAETFVEVEQGTETAVLKYDENYLKEVAANSTQPRTTMPGQLPPGIMPGSPSLQAAPFNRTQPSPTQPGASTAPGNIRAPQQITLPPGIQLPPGVQLPPGMQLPAGIQSGTSNAPSAPVRRILTAPQPRTN